MPWASLERVLPVQGAMTRTSSSFFGPMGSASGMRVSTGLPQMASALRRCSSAVPKRLSSVAAEWEKMGMTVCSLARASITGKTLEKVQKEPHMAKPMVITFPPSLEAGWLSGP